MQSPHAQLRAAHPPRSTGAAPPTLRLGALVIGAPATTWVEESVLTLRIKPPGGEPILRSQPPVLSNLIVRTRRVGGEMSLAEAVAAISIELAKTLPHLAGLNSRPFRFDDGAIGRLLSYSFGPPPSSNSLRTTRSASTPNT